MDRKVLMTKRMAGYARYMVRGKRLKLELGRAIWKGVIVPRIMYGLAGMSVRKKHLEALDKWQGIVCRNLLGVRRNVPREFYLHEFGCNGFAERISKARISLGKRMLDRNDIMNGLMRNEWKCNKGWISSLRRDLVRSGITDSCFEEEDMEYVMRKVRTEQSNNWWSGLENKRSLGIYGRVCRKKLDKRSWNQSETDRVVLRNWSGNFWYDC